MHSLITFLREWLAFLCGSLWHPSCSCDVLIMENLEYLAYISVSPLLPLKGVHEAFRDISKRFMFR
ncbi:hypothetical protein E2C01_076834 [Portunus trituberculatus]|uniref:Secreted protein n=1 Tax=Portunus trituberculatus TaxID=210409 RepID=A0A5B7IK34_PORTR|nr:hypothetical protein [Portunus trituberculatus]